MADEDETKGAAPEWGHVPKDEDTAGDDEVSKHSLGADKAKKGAYVRIPSKFHNHVTKDGSSGWPAEKNRYHLLVSHACPWAHRTVMTRLLKGLEDVIGVTYCGWDYVRLSDRNEDYKGWRFDEPEPFFGATTFGDFYEAACPGYYASYLPDRPPLSTPVLFDSKTRKIVSNESAEIIKMLNSEFNEWATNPELDLNPEDLRGVMSEVDGFIYPGINDGVYRNGFARTQEAYNEASEALWDALDRCEEILSTRRYIAGDRLTLSDVRLFVTLSRFDPVYVTHFKCNRNRLSDMPNLFNLVKELYQLPGVAASFNWESIRKHYYLCHTNINPSRIIPVGLKVDYLSAHDRADKFPDAVTPGLTVAKPSSG